MSLYLDVDVIGVGEHLDIEIEPIIQEGERWVSEWWSFQQPDRIVGNRVIVMGETRVLLTGDYDHVTVYPKDKDHPRLRIELA